MKQFTKIIFLIIILSLIKISYCYKDYNNENDNDKECKNKKIYITDTFTTTKTDIITTTVTTIPTPTPQYCEIGCYKQDPNGSFYSRVTNTSPYTYNQCSTYCQVRYPNSQYYSLIQSNIEGINYYSCYCYTPSYTPIPLQNTDNVCTLTTDVANDGNRYIYGQYLDSNPFGTSEYILRINTNNNC